MKKRLSKSEALRIGREFGKALAAELARRSARTFPQSIARFRRLTDDYVRRLSAHPRLARELKRRTAEAMLELTIMLPSKMAVCRRRFQSLSKLGFTNIENKAHFHLIYARAALTRGHRQIARSTAHK